MLLICLGAFHGYVGLVHLIWFSVVHMSRFITCRWSPVYCYMFFILATPRVKGVDPMWCRSLRIGDSCFHAFTMAFSPEVIGKRPMQSSPPCAGVHTGDPRTGLPSRGHRKKADTE